MKIIEKYLVSKYNNINDSEDAIFISDNFIGVIDGATSKSSFSWGDLTSAEVAAQLICDTMENMPFNANAQETINLLNGSINRFYIKNQFYDTALDNPEDRLTASVVLYSKHHKEVWMVGDCQCIIDSKLYTNDKLVDKVISEIRAFFLHTEILKGKSIKDLQAQDTGRDFIMPLLKRQTRFQNQHGYKSIYTYGVIDGFKTHKDHIKIIECPNAKQIVFASDGYPYLKPTLEESEIELKSLLSEDPLLISKYKSTKGLQNNQTSFDDRAFIKFLV